MKTFGNIFEYNNLKTLPCGNIIYYTCILPSGTCYSTIELDVDTGNLIYHHGGQYFGTFPIQLYG
jgi:hypothetical protein